MRGKASTRPHAFPTVMVCLAVLAGSGVAGYLYTAAERKSFNTEVRDELAAVADMKVRQVVAWREERIGDAKILALDPSTLMAAGGNLSNGRNKAEIETWMGQLLGATDYTAVSLWDRDYRQRIWMPASNPPNDRARELIMQAMRAKAPLLGDLHRVEPTGAAHMVLAAPLLRPSSSEPSGALLLEIDPGRFLYPLIESWPTPSRSAETLLARREGNDVVFLNELRHRKDTALKLRFPIASAQLPAAKGALGYEGVLEGVDYRGVPVLAVIKGVPGSPWFMVAKVDSEEVLAPLRQRTRFIAGFFGLAGVTLIAGILLLWSRQAAALLRRQEAVLLREKEFTDNLIKTAQIIILVLDLRGRIISFNPYMEQVSGYRLEDVKGRDWFETFLPKEDCTGIREIFLRAIGDTQTRGNVNRIITKGGKTVLVEWHDKTLTDVNDRVTGLLAIGQDITERKRAEDALRESEGRYRSLFEQSGDLILVLELRDGPPLILDANQAALRAYGYSREEMVGQPVSLIDPHITQEVVEERDRLLAEEKRIYMTRRRKDGSVFDVESVVRRIEMGARNIVLAVERDITERKRAEEERNSLQLQLAQAQKMESIGRLAGGVAHDFNNLLTVINGYSHLLLGKLSEGDPMRAGLAEIHKAGERAAWLTRQLLAFSRKQVLAPRVLDLNRVVEEMRPMLARLMGEDVELHVALNAENGAVRADPHQLEQVLMNLAVNARDAMPGGGKLSIETALVEWDESYVQSHPEAHAGRYIKLAVSDHGVGMDEETRQKIFEPFFTTKEVGHGTGLGLAMVQGIVAQSGGCIEVHSEPGQGTAFMIYLPALAEAAVDAGRPAAVPALEGRETVLVVEDQAEVRDYAVAALKAYGYRVLPAANAGEALLLCERERGRIDLLLTDVAMPNASGQELAGQLEALRPGIKVLFVSGHTDDAVVRHGVLEEDVNFIQKPFTAEELAGKVRTVLGPPKSLARILVADDEAGVRAFLRAALEQGGHEVIDAADGKQALKQVRAGHVDLVITDLVMPEQEGIETIQALRKEMPGVGIIAISGAFGGQFLKTAQLLGADAVLTKPVSAELLLAKVAEVLKGR